MVDDLNILTVISPDTKRKVYAACRLSVTRAFLVEDVRGLLDLSQHKHDVQSKIAKLRRVERGLKRITKDEPVNVAAV